MGWERCVWGGVGRVYEVSVGRVGMVCMVLW